MSSESPAILIVEDDADVTLTRSNFFDIAKEYPFGISRIEAVAF